MYSVVLGLAAVSGIHGRSIVINRSLNTAYSRHFRSVPDSPNLRVPVLRGDLLRGLTQAQADEIFIEGFDCTNTFDIGAHEPDKPTNADSLKAAFPTVSFEITPEFNNDALNAAWAADHPLKLLGCLFAEDLDLNPYSAFFSLFGAILSESRIHPSLVWNYIAEDYPGRYHGPERSYYVGRFDLDEVIRFDLSRLRPIQGLKIAIKEAFDKAIEYYPNDAVSQDIFKHWLFRFYDDTFFDGE